MRKVKVIYMYKYKAIDDNIENVSVHQIMPVNFDINVIIKKVLHRLELLFPVLC